MFYFPSGNRTTAQSTPYLKQAKARQKQSPNEAKVMKDTKAMASLLAMAPLLAKESLRAMASLRAKESLLEMAPLLVTFCFIVVSC